LIFGWFGLFKVVYYDSRGPDFFNDYAFHVVLVEKKWLKMEVLEFAGLNELFCIDFSLSPALRIDQRIQHCIARGLSF
jgi:hypothetical protein